MKDKSIVKTKNIEQAIGKIDLRSLLALKLVLNNIISIVNTIKVCTFIN